MNSQGSQRPCPRFFYFDMGNVLLDFDHDIACRRVAALTGLGADRVRQEIFRSGLELRYERGELTTEEFHSEFCRRTGAEIAVDQLAEACSDIFSLKPEMPGLLRQLRAAGHRLGLLSNTCAAHWQFVYPRGFAELWPPFEQFALSFELRSLKPEPEIYQQAAALAGCALAEIFFVDDRADNIAQARDLGMDAVQFESPERLIDDLRVRGAL